MTEQEARRIIDEALSIRPKFVVGRSRYVVQPDGKVDIYRLTKSGKTAIFEHTVAADTFWLPPNVRSRALEFTQ